VDDEGTAMSVGGAATAMNSAAGNDKLAVSNDVDTSDVTVGLDITAGTYTIQPDDDLDVGEANFVCPAVGVPCVVTVTEEANDDGTTATITIKSTGGVATIRNTMAVMTTRAALR
jgi:hypothetical protein